MHSDLVDAKGLSWRTQPHRVTVITSEASIPNPGHLIQGVWQEVLVSPGLVPRGFWNDPRA